MDTVKLTINELNELDPRNVVLISIIDGEIIIDDGIQLIREYRLAQEIDSLRHTSLYEALEYAVQWAKNDKVNIEVLCVVEGEVQRLDLNFFTSELFDGDSAL